MSWREDKMHGLLPDILSSIRDELAEAISDLDTAIDGYKEDWEDEVLGRALRLQVFLIELVESIESLTGEKSVDQWSMSIYSDP